MNAVARECEEAVRRFDIRRGLRVMNLKASDFNVELVNAFMEGFAETSGRWPGFNESLSMVGSLLEPFLKT